MDFRYDTRAASIPLTHALSLGITALLIAGLLIGSGQMLDRQSQRVTQKGLADIGEGLTNELVRIDRLVSSGVENNLSSRVTYPARISGETYNIELASGGSPGRAVVYTRSDTETYQVRIQLETDVCPRSVNGGPVEIVYDESKNCITIQPTGR